MAAREKHSIPTAEFIQKRYEISKDLLASAITLNGIDMTAIDTRESDSIIYNCTLMADKLLRELGYVRGDHAQEVVSSKPLTNDKVIPLQELLKNSKD